MEILETIKFYNRTGKLPENVLREAMYQHGLFESFLTEGSMADTPERRDVLSKINNDNYIRNNYKQFADEVRRNKRSQYLTPYTAQDYIKGNIQTYQVPGYEIGFALKPIGKSEKGNVLLDIISVHNNTNIGGIGEALIDSAIRLGGTHLDHYDGFLSDFYSKKGFEEYDRYPWDDQYMPSNWDKEKDGTPDVVMRRLPNI